MDIYDLMKKTNGITLELKNSREDDTYYMAIELWGMSRRASAVYRYDDISFNDAANELVKFLIETSREERGEH